VIVPAVLSGLSAARLSSSTVDVVAHSYGTAVANRLLRELLGGGLQTAAHCRSAMPRPPPLTIHSLLLIDPIVLGGATTGLAGCTINRSSPDMSFAFCGNRAGVSAKEAIDYDVTGGDGAQCGGGVTVYMSADDPLADVHLARDTIKRVAGEKGTVFGDTTMHAFHGRWLVELWFGGYFWHAPCCNNCFNVLFSKLRQSRTTKSSFGAEEKMMKERERNSACYDAAAATYDSREV
jgi:hypothetical protein